MKTKRIISLMIVFFLGIFINGCFEFEERIVLNKDGSGTLEVEYWTMEDVNINNDNYSFPDNEKDIRKDIEEKYTSKRIKLVDLKIKEKEKSRYVRFKVTFDDIRDLNNVPHFQENEIEFRKKGKQIKFNRVVFINDGKTSKCEDEPDNMLEKFILSFVEEGLSHIKFRFEIETPYKIDKTNADWTPGDNRAVWKFRLSDVMYQNDVEMSLTTK